jgi:hypothetical protein
VAFAPEGKPGSTTLETDTFVFGAEPPAGTPSNPPQPLFFPIMAQADVHLAAAGAVSGGQLPAPTIKLDFNYIDKDLLAT